MSYFHVLFLEDEGGCELASLLGEVDLNEPVSLLPARLPQSPGGLPYDNEPLLETHSMHNVGRGNMGAIQNCWVNSKVHKQSFDNDLQPRST